MYTSVFFDHNIVSISKGTVVLKKENELFSVDLNKCGKDHPTSRNCVGDRNIIQKYFVLNTENGNWVIKFKKIYVFDFFNRKVLSGTRTDRFLQFQNALNLMGYRTYDLT